ncbi:DEAD/DEAH box helicase [Stachybotrys elegans]|uniref:DEAD/DEAH box helicase n=1 Tax=Stachybotrys elegans TaxID=80388 RepID=A0A8K0T8K1_9HYPO|nr:DEAD/DEAH box helicase [Stachybotrys elegans]
MQGILHKTSIEAAQNRSSASSAGQKRSWSDHEGGSAAVPGQPNEPVRFQRAISLPNTPTRLTPSEIVRLHDEEGPSEYSQRLRIAATPSGTADPELRLSHPVYGLPPQLVANFAGLGIEQIYPWQKACLKGPGLLAGTKNLVYCAPTGGGKSLVADLLMLRRVLEEPNSKALLILPYVALVQEKVQWLRAVVQGLKPPSEPTKDDDNGRLWRRRADEDIIRVIGFFGGGKVRSTWADFDIGVCTIEKANALVNTAIDECNISQLKSVVLDELHMIDDDHRGYILELITSKILSLEQAVQIVGMSATLPNIDLIAQWLGGHSYLTRYRPVPIEEHLVHNGLIYSSQEARIMVLSSQKKLSQETEPPRPARHIRDSAHKEFNDPVLNAVVSLAYETAAAGSGVLVFAGSRGQCESDARWISRVMPQLHELDSSLMEKRLDLMGDLRNLSTGIDPVLEETVPYGAGLTSEERDLIASAYDRGIILVCVATCSLAAGINLPARRVILHNARMGRELVGPAMLRQMRGRAGRQGKAPVGETYLCCREADLEPVLELMHAELPNVSSCLELENRRLQRGLLEVIAVKLATSRDSLGDYLSKTLLSQTSDAKFLNECLEKGLHELEGMGLISRDLFDNFTPSQLGKAIVASALDPDDGLFIYKELSKTLRAFVMDGDMHILYTFSPVHDNGLNVNWQVFRDEMQLLDDSGIRVLTFLGIRPTTVLDLAHGASFEGLSKADRDNARVYRRFYVALQLRDLCNEMPVHMVARKYDVPRGTVQSLSQTCQGFAAGMIKFCEQMGWGVMAAALDHFSGRLVAGARADLLALAKIAFIKSRTARVFWENGFRTIASVANADPKQLLPILMQAQPNKLRVKSKDKDKYEEKLLAKAEAISASANRLWQIQMQSEMQEE